ncbi:MAG: S-adenosylmethionine:tRNA ribosyltransferase-isomerase [Chloroflexi bacterium]|nr:S-adenosylmethionine:tRNA ribosyltransferase-isomerase [Chloroflexota bacterium]
MKLAELAFERPEFLQAIEPPEVQGVSRDAGRLLISSPQGHFHAEFTDLPHFLDRGDLLVVNESATIPASLPAAGPSGPFIVNLSTRYGADLWLVEPRPSYVEPGPLDLEAGDRIVVAGVPGHLVRPYPGIDRLWFVRFDRPLERALDQKGSPIRYGYTDESYPLSQYQTLFSRVPGSAEMPSAARPFTVAVVSELAAQGVEFASIVLHTGVSSLEVKAEQVEDQPLYPEPFEVSAATARQINATRERGGSVIAVGTTVARAVETAWDDGRVREASGFTRLFIHPGRGVQTFDGLLTGFHDPKTTHLALLYAVAGRERILEAYAEAVRAGYLWHEFGDSHLILR